MYLFGTRAGDFLIKKVGQRWHLLYAGRILGIYKEPDRGAWELSHGHMPDKPPGIDLAELKIPTELKCWQCVPDDH